MENHCLIGFDIHKKSILCDFIPIFINIGTMQGIKQNPILSAQVICPCPEVNRSL